MKPKNNSKSRQSFVLLQKYFLEQGIKIQHKQKYVLSKIVMLIMIFLGHISMLLEATFYGLGMVLVFRVIVHFHLYFLKANELLCMIPVMIFAITYMISAGLVINGLSDDYKQVSLGLLYDDMEPFLTRRAMRIASTNHVILGVTSILTLVSIMLIDWSDTIAAGEYTVFTISFLMMIIFITAIEQDDMENCRWFEHKIPEHWKKTDLKTFLANKKKIQLSNGELKNHEATETVH